MLRSFLLCCSLVFCGHAAFGASEESTRLNAQEEKRHVVVEFAFKAPDPSKNPIFRADDSSLSEGTLFSLNQEEAVCVREIGASTRSLADNPKGQRPDMLCCASYDGSVLEVNPVRFDVGMSGGLRLVRFSVPVSHKGQSLSGMILQLKGLLLHNEGTAEKPQWRSNKKVREVGYHIFSHTHETVEQLNKKRFQLAHASQEFMKEKLAEFTQKRFVPARTLPAFLPGSAAFRLDGWKHNGTWEPSDDFLGRSLKHDVPKDEDPEKFKDRFVEFVRSNLYIQRSCRDFFDRDTSGALFEAIGYSCYPCVFDEKQVPAAMMQMFFAGSTHRFHLVMKDGLCSNLLNLFFLT